MDSKLSDSGSRNVQPWLRRFLNQLRGQRNVSPHTLRAYSGDLREFEAFFKKAGEKAGTNGVEGPAGFNRNLVRAYIIALQARALKRPSVLRKLSCLRSFFRYLQAEGVLRQDPFLNVPIPKRQPSLPRALSHSEMDQLLAAAPPAGLAQPKRDRALVELLYSCGLRRDEARRLSVADVDFIGGSVRVFGKGSRERVVPVGNPALKALREYLTARPRREAGEDPLFANGRGGRLSGGGIALIVRRWARSAGFLKPLTPHVFRHSFATHLLDGGCDLRMVQEMLGHRSLSTTQVYTKLSLERLRKVYESSHPRAGRATIGNSGSSSRDTVGGGNAHEGHTDAGPQG